MPALFFLLFVAFLLGILIGWLMRRRPSGDGRVVSVFSPGPDQQPRADTLPGPEAASHKDALSLPSPLPHPFPGPIPSPFPSPIPIPIPIPQPVPSPIPSPFPSPIPGPIPIPIPVPSPIPIPFPIPIPDPNPIPDPHPRPDPGQICVPPAVADQYAPAQLGSILAVHLAGSLADGSRAPASQQSGPVIWVDRGDEVLVHLESTQVRIQGNSVLVSVDLETDQTGRQPLVVAFSLGDGTDGAGLVATTDELPRGNGLLAARWGQALQSAVWASLLNMAQIHATERRKAPLGLSINGNTLNFQAGAPLVAAAPAQVIR